MTDEARLHGERIVMWDRSAIDWGWLGAAPRIAERLSRVRAGDIVLMHDGQNQHNRPDQRACGSEAAVTIGRSARKRIDRIAQ